MDEPGLIQAAKKGDLQAFNRLVLGYQDMVYNQAFRMMGEIESAEDATQDAFILAFRHIRGFRGGSFKAWLLRIVTNVCYDELRRRKRRPTVALEPMDENEEEIESPHWLADPNESPEEASERREMSLALQQCLDQLPIEFKTVVVLVDVQGRQNPRHVPRVVRESVVLVVPVPAGANHFNVGDVFQQVSQFIARQLLVIDDNGTPGHRAFRHENGSITFTVPGSAGH